MVFATDSKEDNKNNQKDKDQEQVEASANEELQPADQPSQSQESAEEESVVISSVSFNFLFYLIYKIKYADIFNIISRKKEDSNSSSFSGVQINQLIEKLTNPSL